MKKTFILIIIAIVTFTCGFGLGNGIIYYVFREEITNSETLANNDSDNSLNNENINSEDNLIQNSDSPLKNDKINSSEDEYIFSKSNIELLNYNDISNLSKEEIEKGKNEIFARYGHDFSSQMLKEYFSQKSWYTPVSGKKVSVTDLNSVEQKNVIFLDTNLKNVTS